MCLLAALALLTCFPSGRPAEDPSLRAGSAPTKSQAAPSAPAASASAAGGQAGALQPGGASSEPGPVADRFAVSAESPVAARAALDVLARGGSAADAAVAGLLVAGVAQPVSSGIGGGGFALYWDASSGSVTVLDFRETAPMGLRPSDYPDRLRPKRGRGAMVGVPGEIAGLWEMHQRWGKLPFAELVEGAAERAEQGFELSHHMGRSLGWNEAWVLETPAYRGIFAPLGELLATGQVATNPALARTLRRIATEGRRAFYRGAVGRDVVATAQAAGSRMVMADLERYQVVERQPLRTTWAGREIYTMPPPSAGGLMMLQSLHLYEPEELRAWGHGTAVYYHMLAESFRASVADRIRYIGDPAYVKMDVARLVSRERMRERRALISPERTRRAESFPLCEAGTSHFVALDAEGNAVSVTSTINHMFGAKLVTRGGFPLNDELDDFTTESLERLFEARRRPNAPRGGARPVSSMTPTIAVQDGRAVLAVGGSGGTRIATSVSQVLLAQLAFGRQAEQAVGDPRIHTPADGGLLVDEAVSAETVAELRRRGEVIGAPRPNYSAVGLITVTESSGLVRIDAAADPRKGGLGLVGR